jgi:hypothetical protein
MASKFMAPKFMGNAAFEARLLQPSHQRTVWTVNKLERPIPGRPTLPPVATAGLKDGRREQEEGTYERSRERV